MKAIHSFRSNKIRPALESFGGASFIRFYLMTAGLSASTIAKHYSKFEFITDDAGAEMAKACLFPYTDITSVGANFDSDSSFWTHSKFIGYLSDEPFLHFDNDLFLWEPLPERIHRAEVSALHTETFEWPAYERRINMALAKIPNFPLLHETYFANKTPLNMAIFGGNNLKIIHSYANTVLDIVLNTLNGFKGIDEDLRKTVEYIMPVMEQLWGSQLIQSKHNVRVELALKETDVITGASVGEIKLTHLWGLKQQINENPDKKQALMAKVEKNLKEINPEVYNAIVKFTTSPNTLDLLLESA